MSTEPCCFFVRRCLMLAFKRKCCLLALWAAKSVKDSLSKLFQVRWLPVHCRQTSKKVIQQKAKWQMAAADWRFALVFALTSE